MYAHIPGLAPPCNHGYCVLRGRVHLQTLPAMSASAARDWERGVTILHDFPCLFTMCSWVQIVVDIDPKVDTCK